MQTLEQIVLLACVDTFQSNSAEMLQHRRSPELQRITLSSDRNGVHQVPILSPVQDGGMTLYDVDVVTVNSLVETSTRRGHVTGVLRIGVNDFGRSSLQALRQLSDKVACTNLLLRSALTFKGNIYCPIIFITSLSTHCCLTRPRGLQCCKAA